MQTLAHILRGQRRKPRHVARFRHRALFVRQPLDYSTPLDRNQRAALIFLAEGLERRTKAKGRQNGALGAVGLELLRALLFRFADKRTGLCFPSYLTLQAVTGRCRGAIAAALRRLECAGVLIITRRLKRIWIVRQSPITGQPERILATVQDSNLYAFSGPAALAGRLDAYVEGFTPSLPRKVDALARLIRALNKGLGPSPRAIDSASDTNPPPRKDLLNFEGISPDTVRARFGYGTGLLSRCDAQGLAE